jgi:FkbM family methyltransferase
MALQSTVLYRLYFAPKTLLGRVMRRWPSTEQPIENCKRWLKKFLLPKGPRMVRVRAGLSAGLAMRLRFPEEAGIWRGEHEPLVQKVMQSAIHPGWTVFDVGAYIGSLSLGAARLAGETGHVVAFEGDPANVARLREHAAANRLDEVLQIVPSAVWSQSSEAGIPFRCGLRMRSQGGVETGEHRPILGAGELIHVPVVSLDDFIAASGLVPQLIKIDVEGGEAEVLRGGETLFTTHRPLLIVEAHTLQALAQVRIWLEQHAYTVREEDHDYPVPVCLLAWPRETNPELPAPVASL